MGGRQSRVETPNSRPEEDDSWMSRVEVKPSQMLVKRLEQQQRNQAASQDYGSDEAPLEPVAADERNEDEGTYLAARQEEVLVPLKIGFNFGLLVLFSNFL